MLVKIKLTRESDTDYGRELGFDQDTISIGRDPKNLVRLESPLVSKAHAKIERNGPTYFVIDLKSTNSTFVNGEKLVPGRPQALRSGDMIKVGDFVLEFGLPQRIAPKEPPLRTAEIEPPARVSAEAKPMLNKILEQYKNPELVQQRVELKKGLVDALKQMEQADVQTLLGQLESVQNECRALKTENQELRDQLAARAQERPEVNSVTTSLSEQSMPSDQRMSKVVDVLLQAMAKLIVGRSSFCTEFLSITMVRQSDSEPLYSGSGDRVKKFLFDATVSEKDAENRLEYLRQASDEVLFHVVGLLDGYRKSVSEGTRRLLQRIDPDLLWGDAMNMRLQLGPFEVPYRFIPFLVRWKWMQLYRKRHAELMGEDRGVLETGVFRPGFVDGYRHHSVPNKSGIDDDD